MEPRHRRWKESAERICRRLGRYSASEVLDKLFDYEDGIQRRSRPSGAQVPTMIELSQFLARSRWSVRLGEIDGAVHYEYRPREVDA